MHQNDIFHLLNKEKKQLWSVRIYLSAAHVYLIAAYLLKSVLSS